MAERAKAHGWGARLLHYRLAFVGIATLVLFVVVTLPFSLASVLDDVLGAPESRVFPIDLLPEPPAPAEAHSRLHLSFIGFDELQRLATIRLSGHRLCAEGCPAAELVLFSLSSDEDVTEGLPPSVTIQLPASTEVVGETFQLPVQGMPVRYPFDRFDLVLALVYQEAQPDGREETLERSAAAERLFLTVQEKLPRMVMEQPEVLDPAALAEPNDLYVYLYAARYRFDRPVYLRVLTIALILLVSAAAAYAVFMRPLAELVIGSGALMLGVWGIRAILTPTNQSYLTAVELSLATVILFLLAAITVRALWYFHERAGLNVLPVRRAPSEADPPAKRRHRRFHRARRRATARATR